jgi:Glycosyl-4,4'-diaponeurosporenoate acyltransferase
VKLASKTFVPGVSIARQFLNALVPPALVGAALALSAVTLGPGSVPFALLLNCFVLSQVAGSTQAVSIALPEPYFRLQRAERGGRVYLYLGIRPFKRLMTSRVYRRLNPHFNFSASCMTPRELVGLMRDAEAAHAVAFGLMLLCSGAALFAGLPRAAGWLLVFNVIGNGYPVMLQRFNRGRVERIFREGQSRNFSNNF